MADNPQNPSPNQGSGILNEVSTLIKDMATNSFDAASGKYRAKSIAERARKSVMMYKVGVSASVKDLEIATSISKYLETMYAIFTMINLGYNPYAKSGDEIAKVIDSVSAEAYDPTKAINCDANKAFANAMKIYEHKGASRKSRIGRNASISTEDFDFTAARQQKMDDDHQKALDDHTRAMDQHQREVREQEKYEKEILDAEEAKKDATDTYKMNAFINNLDKISTRGTPTIVTLKTKYTEIPLAIKANLYGIATPEIKNMLESAVSGRAYNALRYVKWRSGEISTLAWLFNTDIAERDKKLYKSLGRNPWYIDLMKRKTAAKMTSFSKFMVNSGTTFDSKDALKAVKADIKNLKDLPPTASLIVTKNDLVSATNLDINHFTKNDSVLKNIMKNLYLICLGIVDPDTETISFFFDGYTYPFYLEFKDLKKTSDSNQTLYEAIKELARRS